MKITSHAVHALVHDVSQIVLWLSTVTFVYSVNPYFAGLIGGSFIIRFIAKVCCQYYKDKEDEKLIAEFERVLNIKGEDK